MASSVWKAGTIASFLIVFLAYYSRRDVDNDLKIRINSILDGLVKVEKEHVVIPKKVAVGYGACLDVFVHGKHLLAYEDAAATAEHFSHISSKEELLKTYAYFFRHGAAAERYMSNSSLFDELVQLSVSLSDTRHAIGGNAPVMALRFVEEGFKVILAARMTQQLQESLPNGVEVVGRAVDKDDVHFIMEYKAGEQWGPYQSPRANRFIVHNDDNNPTVSSVEDFDEVLKDFNPNLLVVSGLQMMDSFPFETGVREKRLSLVQAQMKSQPPTTRVHFEMASFSEISLLTELVDNVVPYADSLGMNEQELANLHSILMFGNISLVADSIPRVAVALDQMREVFELVRERSEKTVMGRPLTRLHVHTLAYQAIMTTKSSPWKNSVAAAAKASLTAYRHVCGSKEVDVDKAMLIMDDSFSTSLTSGSPRVALDESQPVSCWEESDGQVEICVAPVLVCTQARQTAGGGDNISSAALVYQV